MSTLGRFVLIIWLFVVLIINSSYTASLTSILTAEQLSSPITGIDALVASDKPIGFQIGSFAENYLTDELNIPKSRLVALGSPEEYAVALKRGTVAAVVDEQPYIDLFLSEHCRFSVRGQEFTKSGWGFVSISDFWLAFSFLHLFDKVGLLSSHLHGLDRNNFLLDSKCSCSLMVMEVSYNGSESKGIEDINK